jgi:hypothetical protein
MPGRHRHREILLSLFLIGLCSAATAQQLQRTFEDEGRAVSMEKVGALGPARGNTQLYAGPQPFDVLGQRVETPVNEELAPGSYLATFDASGKSSGVYSYRLQIGGLSPAKRMVLLK